MILVEAKRSGDGLRMVARGHADYAPRGQDIVCSGVSALLFGYAAYLESLSPAKADGGTCPHLTLDEGNGYLYVRTCGLGGLDLLGWRVVAAGLSRLSGLYPACLEIRDETICIPDGSTEDAPTSKKGRTV